MTNQQHPITPSPELVEEWVTTIYQETEDDDLRDLYIATQAARWGADQELEACVEWVVNTRAYDMTPGALRAVRRPKPPSLKKQALQALGHLDKGAESQMDTTEAVDTIRRALETLDD